MIRVGLLSVAPVKGLGLSHPDSLQLEREGVRQNRAFYLVAAEDGRLANGKLVGELVRVETHVGDNLEWLALHLPDGSVVKSDVALGEPVETNFYGRPVTGRVVVGPFAEALSSLAGRDLRLVRPDVPGAANDVEHQVTIVSRESCARLAKQLGVPSVDERRFRMVIGITGAQPHEEDEWDGRRVRIGEAVVSVAGTVPRCAVTTHDPETGRPNLDTLKAILEYRTEPGGTIPFGMYADVVEPGRVRVADPVEPL